MLNLGIAFFGTPGTTSAEKLNKALSDYRLKFEAEKSVLIKEHKANVKIWKKDLGAASSNQIKLERKVAMLEEVQEVEVAPEPMYVIAAT